MANSNIKLYYYETKGRGELIRLILTWAGKEFEDIRLSKDKWLEIKPISPFEQLPFVDIDGKIYGQSLAIAQFFAREFNLYGKTNLDALKIEEFVQLVEDYFKEGVTAFYESDESKKAEIKKKIKEEDAPKYLGFANKLLEQNSGEHFVGDKFTLADILIYDVATGFLKEYSQEAIEKFPLLTALVEKVGNNDKIRAYTQAHK